MHETVRCLCFSLGWHVCAGIILCESSQCHSVIFKDTAGPIAPTSSSITLCHGLLHQPTQSVWRPQGWMASLTFMFFSCCNSCEGSLCVSNLLAYVPSRSVVPSSLWPHGPGSSAHGISQARTLEWGAISSSRRSSQLRDRTLVSVSPALPGGFFPYH